MPDRRRGRGGGCHRGRAQREAQVAPVKLRAWLSDRFPGVAFPSPSTIAAILERRGLVRLVKRRRRAGPVAGAAAPFPACEEPTRCGASNSRALRGAP
jgi:hypothetical protein